MVYMNSEYMIYEGLFEMLFTCLWNLEAKDNGGFVEQYNVQIAQCHYKMYGRHTHKFVNCITFIYAFWPCNRETA